MRQRLPPETVFLALLVGQLFLAAALSPVWRGGAIQATLDFAKVLMIVLVIVTAVSTPQRLRVLIFTQAISVSVIATVVLWKGRLLLGRLEGILGGNYSDPNDMALTIVMSLPLCLALLFLSRNRLWKILWAVSRPGMTYVILYRIKKWIPCSHRYYSRFSVGVCHSRSSALFIGARSTGRFHSLAVVWWDVGRPA